MAGIFGFEPQPQRGSVRSSDVGAMLAQSAAPQQQMAPGGPQSSPAGLSPGGGTLGGAPMGSQVAAALNDMESVLSRGGTGARPKGALAEGRLSRLGISPTEIELLKRAGVV